jgi:hypothetical protein
MMRLKLPYASKSGGNRSLYYVEFLDHLFVVIYYLLIDSGNLDLGFGQVNVRASRSQARGCEARARCVFPFTWDGTVYICSWLGGNISQIRGTKDWLQIGPLNPFGSMRRR